MKTASRSPRPQRARFTHLGIGTALAVALASTASAAIAEPPKQYPPLSAYMMTPEAEIALARSAGPETVSAHATVMVLTETGFKIAAQGDNGFTCLVLRGWSAPSFTPIPMRDIVYDADLRAPICYDPVASRTVLPLQELRTDLAMHGNDPDAIARGVATAYASGKLPKMEAVAFAYMWSAHQFLGKAIGAWHPHMMVYAPFYDNAMLGNNPLMGGLPVVVDDAGTPFAVVVIPVHGVPAVELTPTKSTKAP